MTSTLTYYLKVCDMELIEEYHGAQWKKNLTIEDILQLENKINPFIFCEIVLMWILDVRPESSVINRLIDVLLSFKLSYWFYYDITNKIINMGYLRERQIHNKLNSLGKSKYERQSWILSGVKLDKFVSLQQVKVSQACDIPGCKTFHSVTIKLEPLFDNKIRLIKDKMLKLNNEHRHHLYCHWYICVVNMQHNETTLWLSTSEIEDIKEELKSANVVRLYSLLPAVV